MTTPICHACDAVITAQPDAFGKTKCACGATNFPNGAKLSPGVNFRRAILLRGGPPVLVRFDPKPFVHLASGERGWTFDIDDARLEKPIHNGFPGHLAEEEAWFAVSNRFGPIIRWEAVPVASSRTSDTKART